MNAHAERRARLAFDGKALLAAGRPPAKNYAGNPFPFRAGSHFLYFVGRPLEGAYVLLDGGRWTVFATPPDDDDALWHGESLSLDALAEELACDVRPLAELDAACGGAATIPSPDSATRLEQERLLGRSLIGLAGSDLDLARAVIDVRTQQDAHALRELRAAAEATVAAHRAGMAGTRPGVREYEVRADMEYALAKRGMSTAYTSIVTVHGEVLHNHDHSGTCRDGDLLLADVGAETAGGFAGDVTRTWPVSGTFSSSQRDVYDVVLASQLAAIEAVAPGVRYRDVHLRACEVLAEGLVDLGILRGDASSLVEQGAHAIFFPHGVGHLLGLDVHDMEDLGDLAGYDPGRSRSEAFGLSFLRMDRDLLPGMVVTIEPGFYQVPAILKGDRFKALRERVDFDRLGAFADVRGIRIEDDVLVTEGGHEVLTVDAPKTPDAVEAAVRG